MAADDISRLEQTVGRYMLFGQIGAGGMAAVHLGRRVGPAGFSRLVAIKRLHPHLGKEREFVHSFLDEARIAARVSHPNVVSIDDVVMDGDEVLLVMEYVNGRSLSLLEMAAREQGRVVPTPVAAAIAIDMLHGLQAAHAARDERGRGLGLVHRDVSPQNVLVGVDGVARVLDFGIAKALGRLQSTDDGAIKGKLAYMAPERLRAEEVTIAVDIYGAGIVMWELVAGERYLPGPSDEKMFKKVLEDPYRHLSDPALEKLDAVLERALRRDPAERWVSCLELADAIESVVDVASRSEVAKWVQDVAGPALAASADAVEEIERSSVPSPAPVSRASETTKTIDDVRSAKREPQTETAIMTETRSPATGGSARNRVVAVAVAVVIGLVVVAFFVGSRSRSSPAASATPPPSASPVPQPSGAMSSPSPAVVASVPSAPAPSLSVFKPLLTGRRVAAPVRSATPTTTTAPPAITAPPTKTTEPEAPLDRK